MSLLPDSGWLPALDLRASTFAAVALGCWAVFGLADFDILYLGVLPAWVRAAFAIIALLASFLWLGRLWELGLAHFTRWRRKRAILGQLDNVSTSEAALLRGQLDKNEQSFSAMFDGAVVVGLRVKGLLAQATTAGNFLNYPHTIPDFVWAEMRRRWRVAEQPKAPPEDARSRVRRARAGHRT